MSPRLLLALAAIVLVIVSGTVLVMKRSLRAGPGSIETREAAAVGSKPAAPAKPSAP